MELEKDLTEKQKAIKEVLDKIKFEFCLLGKNGSLRKYIEELKREYGILPKNPTLREYLQNYKDNELITFQATVFIENTFPPQKMYFYNEENFCRIFNEKMLDTLYVKKETKINALAYDLVLSEATDD